MALDNNQYVNFKMRYCRKYEATLDYQVVPTEATFWGGTTRLGLDLEDPSLDSPWQSSHSLLLKCS